MRLTRITGDGRASRPGEGRTTSWLGTRLGVAALALLCVLWSVELPIAIFWHGVAYPALGDAYVFLLHGPALTVVALALLAARNWRIPSGAGAPRLFVIACAGFLAVGAAPLLISTVSGVEPRYAYQQFVFGHLAPVLFVAAVLSVQRHEQQRLWSAFYFGWVAFLAVSLAVLVLTWRVANDFIPQFGSATVAQQLITWRFTLGEPWNIYGVLMGNANKMSNYLIMFLLMSDTLLTLDGATRRRDTLLALFWLLGLVTLTLMFSRAALLLLPVAFLASGVFDRIPHMTRWLGATGFCAGITVLWFATPELFQYLFMAQYAPDVDGDALGTFNERFAQWSQLIEYFATHTREALVGLGTSGYGMQFFGQPENGTHNTFLDLWAEAGILSPLLLLLTMVSIGVQVLVDARSPKRKRVVGAGLLLLTLLMTREHSFSFLFVTSLGGLCFAVLMYAAVAPDVAAAMPTADRHGAPGRPRLRQ